MSKTKTPDIVTMLQTAINDRGKGSVWGYAGLLEDATAEIERLRSELAKHQWRTMESAPPSGRVLGLVDGDVRIIGWAKTSHIPFYGWCLLDQGPEDCDLCKPTHWQPLPSPPGENDG